MPEIGSKNAILVNPESVEEITAMMLRLEKDPVFYQQQRELGLKRAELFSWSKTAEQLLELYKEVYHENKKK